MVPADNTASTDSDLTPPHPPVKSRHGRRFGLALILLVGLLGLLGLLWRGRSLTARATRLITFARENGIIPFTCVWLTPTQVQYDVGMDTRVYDLRTRKSISQDTAVLTNTERIRLSNRFEEASVHQFKDALMAQQLQDDDQTVAATKRNLPPKATIIGIADTPDGRRRAWLVTQKRASVWGQWLRRFLPSYKIQIQNTLTLYVSAQDGSAMREIGSQTLPADETASNDALSVDSELQWLPDNKRISFFYDHALWLIDAD